MSLEGIARALKGVTEDCGMVDSEAGPEKGFRKIE